MPLPHVERGLANRHTDHRTVRRLTILRREPIFGTGCDLVFPRPRPAVVSDVPRSDAPVGKKTSR